MTYTDPTPATADDSPDAVLEGIRRDYRESSRIINETTKAIADEKDRFADACIQYKKAMGELTDRLAAAKTAKRKWNRMLPDGDTARGNGTQ